MYESEAPKSKTVSKTIIQSMEKSEKDLIMLNERVTRLETMVKFMEELIGIKFTGAPSDPAPDPEAY